MRVGQCWIEPLLRHVSDGGTTERAVGAPSKNVMCREEGMLPFSSGHDIGTPPGMLPVSE